MFTAELVIVYLASLAAGRAGVRPSWKIIEPVVIALILTISYWASTEIVLGRLVGILVSSAASALIVTVVTYVLGFIWKGGAQGQGRSWKPSDLRYAVALATGYLAGLIVRIGIPFDLAVQYELLILIMLVGMKVGGELRPALISSAGIKALKSTATAFLGSALSFILIYVAFTRSPSVAAAGAFGFGWYSLAGPLAAKYDGPAAGVFVFLVNFFREQLTFLLVPFLAKTSRNPEGAIAVGGATTMDTTLALFTEVYGSDLGVAALINGLLLSVAVPVLLPVILYL
ncbi:MAG: lysine exporter LysO family protein [Nitrososphaeria archaeon]